MPLKKKKKNKVKKVTKKTKVKKKTISKVAKDNLKEEIIVVFADTLFFGNQS